MADRRFVLFSVQARDNEEHAQLKAKLSIVTAIAARAAGRPVRPAEALLTALVAYEKAAQP